MISPLPGEAGRGEVPCIDVAAGFAGDRRQRRSVSAPLPGEAGRGAHR